LAEIGIPKTTAYRLMKAAETGEPIDYNNEPSATSSRSGTTPEWGDFFERKRELPAAVVIRCFVAC
jgi:hypothetical protein